ncbi:hypothetical protein [Noviherbaspirillum pedocola]|uniref:Uncharacterized protein n=1 Tax=Noviherbaspirillum pedocola TaxID=2801341 RepID=A0A934SUS8_9BURK|nr:hypothetical protein [Noviherbaspirillum pedocola]MBK4735964.1 hypothetical protein [Noviherbaspirillum pedocola]
MEQPSNIYGDLALPPIDPAALKKDAVVLTRIFWNSSVAGAEAKVVKVKTTPSGVSAYCDYGANQSNTRLRKWMPAFALCAKPDTKE